MAARLPIEAFKDEIVEAVKTHQVVIVQGETGSGKTTQIPRYLFESAEIATDGIIGVTEPRRVAATSVAKYVAKQLGCNLGEEVAYQIRFDNCSGEKTRIKFMTDGIILREIQEDKNLSQYSVIMVDEAHERSLNIDLTLGLLKEVIKRRPELKILVTSATIDASKFSEFFDGAPVIQIPGRCYPVEVIYRPFVFRDGFREDHRYPKDAAQLVREIHQTRGKGDILVFMSGMDDITTCADELESMSLSGLKVLIAHGEMAFEDQQKIFMDYPGFRKVIIGTNIIETGITVDGVRYCVDSGYIKETDFDSRIGLSYLRRTKHSKAGCDQRTGRAGRTQPGICWRLYSKRDFERRPDYTKPEILRTELAGLVLHMKSIGIDDIDNFDFIDGPGNLTIKAAHETLYKLGAIGSNGCLTDNGWLMSRLPVEPRSSRMIVEAMRRGCIDHILTIASFRSLRSVFSRPKGKEEEADLAKSYFQIKTSDFLTWLNVYEQYKLNGADSLWAESHYLKSRVLAEVSDIREQLIKILNDAGIVITSSNDKIEIAKCVTAGLVENICHRQGAGGHEYESCGRDLYIFPGSALMRTDPRWFVCNEIRSNGDRTYGIDCQVIKPEWFVEVVSQFCQEELVERGLVFNPKNKTYQGQMRVLLEGQGTVFVHQVVVKPGDAHYAEAVDLYKHQKSNNRRRRRSQYRNNSQNRGKR